MFLWEARDQAGWLARRLPGGQACTYLPLAWVLGETAPQFLLAVSFVLPQAGSDAPSELKIWVSAHTLSRMVSKLESLVTNNRSYCD